MDDLTKILLTQTLTVSGAIVIFIAVQLLGKLVIEPLQDFKRLLGDIRYALVFHAQAALTPVGNRASEDKAADEFRKLACELRSKIAAVPLYDLWSNISGAFLPRRQNAFKASECLIGLSNSVHQENRSEKNSARITKIERLLGFEPIDESPD